MTYVIAFNVNMDEFVNPNFHLEHHIQLTPSFSALSLAVTIMSVTIMCVYQVSIQKILLWTTIASAPLGIIQLLLITHLNRTIGIPDGAFVFGDDVVLAVLGEFSFLSILVLAAKICPPGVEAVLFATLMSIFNGASTVGTEVGAFLTKYLGITESNFDNLSLLTVICSLSSLYPLVFIGLLDDVGSKSEADMEGEAEADLDINIMENGSTASSSGDGSAR